jgi:hypothetical protein
VEIADAQRDVRTVFMGGFGGQLVSSLVWFVSAALATWRSPKAAIISLVVGGFFIFPLTQVLLRLMGHTASLPKGHPMNALGMQVAFTLPFNLLLGAAAALHNLNWFYPAFMIALGSHYLPFIFMYGMWQFGLLAALLIGAGVGLGMCFATSFSAGAWISAVLLLIFALVGQRVFASESSQPRNWTGTRNA